MCVCKSLSVSACLRACVNKHILSCMSRYVRTRTCVYVCVCVYARVRVCVSVRARARLCVCVCARAHAPSALWSTRLVNTETEVMVL